MISSPALRQAFVTLYGREPRLFHAPGRVNLIGEHTDYNSGFVLPMALGLGTSVAAAPREDRLLHVRSLNRKETLELNLDAPGRPQRGAWADYVEGVAQMLDHDLPLKGADLVLDSDVPLGAGLSSSAALEVSVGFALLTLSGQPVDRTALAIAGQNAEHVYVGTRSGIMDPFISAHARAGSALLLDCRDLQATDIPLRLGSAEFLICDTRVKHNLAASEYNARREQCEQAVARLRELKPSVQSLRDVSEAELNQWSEQLAPTLRKRARHVVTENVRTLAAAAALADGELETVGRHMVASHRSLQHDYQVSCAELDVIVDAAMGQPGVLGARMTGGGFGGCAVLLVDSGSLDSVKQCLRSAFAARFGQEPGFFPALASAGARELVASNE